MKTKNKTYYEFTPAEKKIWALACRQAKKHFDLTGTPGARVSYAAGFFACHFYLKRKGLLKKVGRGA